MYQLGWFATSRGKTSKKLLEAVQNSISRGELAAEITFVFSDREPGESDNTDRFFDLVKSYGIPLVCFSYLKFKAGRGDKPASGEKDSLPQWRLEYDREIMKRLGGFNPDIIVLAGYMLIVGWDLCQKYNMINLHPAAPGGPAGTWQEVIWKLIARRAKETGAMMHLVTPELDKGPPVTYFTFSIRGEPFDRYWLEIEQKTPGEIERSEDNPLFKQIRQHGVVREFPLIVSTLKAFSQGRVRVTADKKVTDAAGKIINGYDLSEEINKAIKDSSS